MYTFYLTFELFVDFLYLLEQSAVGSFQRVETAATDGLQMHTPEADEIVMIKQ